MPAMWCISSSPTITSTWASRSPTHGRMVLRRRGRLPRRRRQQRKRQTKNRYCTHGAGIGRDSRLRLSRYLRDWGSAIRNFREIVTNTVARIEGSQIQSSSLLITARPLALKKRKNPIGETRIGLQGKKERWLSNGEKKATPSP